MFFRQHFRSIFFGLFCLAIGYEIIESQKIPNSRTFSSMEDEANPKIRIRIDNNNSTTNNSSNSSSSDKSTDLSNAISNSCLLDKRGKISLLNQKTRVKSSNTNSDWLNLDFALTEVYSLPETPDPKNIFVTSDGKSSIRATHMIETQDGGLYAVASLQGARELICSQK